MMKFFVIVVCVVMSMWLSSALASTRLPFKPTPAELQALPDYCKARLSGDKSSQQRWVQQFGKDNFLHFHHYCVGLNYVNRVRVSFGSKHKKHYIETALGEFKYVLRNWPEDFVLTADAKAYKTQLEAQLKIEESRKR